MGKREHATKIPQRYCPTYTDISRNWPQIRQPGEAPLFPRSTGGARAEKQQGHIEIWISVLPLEAVHVQHTRGVQGTAVLCPGCPWAAKAAGRSGAAASQESTGRGGSCLRRCREPITDLRLQAARPQHLPEWLRGSCAHSRQQDHLQGCGRGQHSSAAQGRWGRRLQEPLSPSRIPWRAS